MKYNIPNLTIIAYAMASEFWEHARAKYAEHNLDIGDMPTVVMNPRLTSTAGRAWSDANKIDLSCYLMTENPQVFQTDIIPHELCHIIACKMHGSTGHDKPWKQTVAFLGAKTKTYHNMTTLSQAKKRKG